jgi:hypothetical protein
MIRSFAATLIAVVAIGSLATPAHADVSISGTLSGDSTLTPTGTPGLYVQNFTGDGDDTVFGSFTFQSTSTIDFSKPPNIDISGGSFTGTFSKGTLFGTDSGSGTASGHGTATVALDFVITGGTGIFKGAKGEVTATETITSTSPTTESANGTYTGSLTTPEPSSLVLLVPTAVVLFCRRRRGAIASSRGQRTE